MSRFCTTLLLIFSVSSVGTGLAGRLHNLLEHPHQVATALDRQQLHRGESGLNGAARPLAAVRCADQDHDLAGDHCLTCVTLHAPHLAWHPPTLDLTLSRAADRVIALQVQRLDASVPAPRGCRGPPLV